jgi:protein-glutamine gamma-glutamyltransferase
MPGASENRTERPLQIHVIALVVLSGVLVDVGQLRVLLTPILLTTSLLAWHYTDRRKVFHLPSWVVGIITLGVIIPLYANFFESSTTEQLLAISHLVAIWISVMFFQRKTPRVYGSLIVLSLLMVVVAAVLGGGPFFGMLLLAYVFTGLSALCLLYVHREELQMMRAAQVGVQRELAACSPDLTLDRFLAGQAPIAYQVPTRAGVTSLWGPGLSWQVVGLGLVTFLFAVGFFLFIPRLGQGDWSQQRPGRQTKVGFSSQMTFEEMGEILQGNQLAMRVMFFDAETNAPYEIFGDAYFSGQALAHYHVHEDGSTSWLPYEMASEGRPIRTPRSLPPGDFVRQEFLLEPTEEPTLFSANPAFPAESGRTAILGDRFFSRLFRPEVTSQQATKQFRYQLNTTAFRNGSQVPVVPYQRLVPDSREPTLVMSPEEFEMLTMVDPQRFPTLVETARKIKLESEEPDNAILVMRRMQSHFLSSEDYTYTLDMRRIQTQRSPDLDPVEDFFAHHRTGHCKFYASALTLMLRSQGIPARIVVGYYGGEFNRLGNYYQVYERDAHAWVEAYLHPEDVPEGIYGQELSRGGGAWYRLDPTPSRVDSTPFSRAMIRVADQTLDYLHLLWTTYVLDMNPDRQADTGLDSLAEEGSEYVSNLGIVRHGIDSVRNLLDPTSDDGGTADGAAASRWPLVILGTLFGLFSAGGVTMLIRRSWKKKRRGSAASRDRRRQRLVERDRQMSSAFYTRLEKILARLGYRREPTQTPREFVQQVDGPDTLPSEAALLLPDELVDIYYRVRFGRQPLQGDEPERIRMALDRLETTLPRRQRQSRGARNGQEAGGPETKEK